jgi:hypothetical protein
MKTLSTIVLEESIKASLVEQDIVNISEQGLKIDPNKRVTGDSTSTSTTTVTKPVKPKPKIDPKIDKIDPKIDPKVDPKIDTKPKPKPLKTKVNPEGIAYEIINSAGLDDDEDRLINAIKQISNSTVFYKVNNVIKREKQQTFSQFIGDEILDTDEWQVWAPILNHLTNILSYNNTSDAQVIKNIMSKTDGIGALTNKNFKLGTKVSKYLELKSSSGQTKKDDAEALTILNQIKGTLGTAGLIALGGLMVCGLVSTCRSKIFKIPIWNHIKVARNGAAAAELSTTYYKKVDKLFNGTGKYNRKQLLELIDQQVIRKNMSLEEAKHFKRLLSNKEQLKRILQFANLQTIKSHFDTGHIVKGDAESIRKFLGFEKNHDFIKKLQQIEDDVVGISKETDDAVTTTKTNIISRQVGKAVTSTWKINTDSMKKWFEVYDSFKPQGFNDVQTFNQLIQKINNYKKNGKNLSTAIIDWSREYGNVKPLWYEDFRYWIDASKGTRTFPFYLKASKFPSYKQWAKDMSLANFNKINQKEYTLQRHYWENINR